MQFASRRLSGGLDYSTGHVPLGAATWPKARIDAVRTMAETGLAREVIGA